MRFPGLQTLGLSLSPWLPQTTALAKSHLANPRSGLASGQALEDVKRAMAQEGSPKSAQKFAIKSPAATSVQLVGDFTHWQARAISLKKDANGIWTTTVDLSPGTYHYRFLVDGEWRDDPECTLRVPNPYGSHDSVRAV